MSALPPKADITKRDWHVRFVPKAELLALQGWSLLGRRYPANLGCETEGEDEPVAT